jgi:hypothetical protein
MVRLDKSTPLEVRTGNTFVRRVSLVTVVTGGPSLEFVSKTTLVPIVGTGETALDATSNLEPRPLRLPSESISMVSLCCDAAPSLVIVANSIAAFVVAKRANSACKVGRLATRVQLTIIAAGDLTYQYSPSVYESTSEKSGLMTKLFARTVPPRG